MQAIEKPERAEEEEDLRADLEGGSEGDPDPIVFTIRRSDLAWIAKSVAIGVPAGLVAGVLLIAILLHLRG